jgi:hypothetical protein
MFMKIHINQKSKIIAVCDESLIGHILKDKEIFMNLDKYRSFYIGEKVSAVQVKKELKGSFVSVNLVGEESVAAAIDAGVAHEQDILYVKKIPYIQIYRI